jgi:hypothetical protein
MTMPDLHDDEPVLEETQPETAAEDAPRGGRTRGILVVGARAITGLIGVAATAATVLAATLLPLPAHQATPPAASVTPVAAPQQRVCAGPMLRLGDDQGGSATIASAVGTPRVEHLATNGTVETTSIAQTDESSGRSATVLTLAPAQDDPDLQPLLAGSQLQAVDSAGLAGLAAAECVEARAETWLVGGSTDTGRTSLLTLANPGAVAATVSISIYSEDGLVEAPGTEGIVVQPNSETSFSLAGFAPGLVSPVVRVTSVGGTVVAHLQQSTVRILEPGGVDIVGPSAAPSTDVIIPGLVVIGHEAIEEKVAEPDYQDITPVLRLFVPGDQAASATIAVTPEGGGDTISVDFDLLPGKVSEFPFEHFEDGGYTVSVTSDVPLVAGARTSTVGPSGASDFVWLESAELMREQALVNIGSGADAALHLSNPATTDAEVTVAVDGASGDTTTVTVPAEGAIAVPVDPGVAYRLSGFTQLRVAVSYTGDGLLAGYTVSPTGPAAERITVYP